MSASAVQNISEADFPTGGSRRHKLEFALKCALHASSERHWQPSQCRVAEHCIELFADQRQALEAADPDGRELIVGCGVSLLYLKLALRHFGCLGRVELFPDLDQPALIARVHSGFGTERDAQERALFDAMTQRRARPSPFDHGAISEATLDALRFAAGGEKGWLEFAQSEITRQRLLDLMVPVKRQQMSDLVFRRQVIIQLEARGGSARSDISNAGLRPGRIQRWTGPLRALTVRTFGSRRLVVERDGEPATHKQTLAVLKTKTDDKHGWVAAGQSMARVLLQAQALGLSSSFLNQAMRSRSARAQLRTSIGRKGFPQVILRFGFCTTKPPFQPGAERSMSASLG